MAVLTPRLLRRGLEWFALISIAGVAAIIIYSRDVHTFLHSMRTVDWRWMLAGIGLASFDWWGGGLRLWLVTRHVHPNPSLGGMIAASGLNTWGSYMTPSQTGGGPVMIWAMRRYGIPYPEGTTSGFVSFVATILFLAIVGPLALALGAGESLRYQGLLPGVTVLGLFRASLSVFVGIVVLILAVLIFPRRVSALLHRMAPALARLHPSFEAKLEGLRVGIDKASDCILTFKSPRGMATLAGAVALTMLCYANKLLAGYVAMRALHLHADFADVLVLQTLITFLLYFVPTPGGSGLAEIVGAAVMSLNVPKELIASYTVLWRFIASYITVGVGSVVFWRLLHARLGEAGPSAVSIAEAEVEASSASPPR
jgi:uncharacterized protein (TIRG00374 family)